MDLITQRMKLKDAFPLMDVTDLQVQYDLKEEPEFVRKGLIPESMTFAEGEHAIITYITTNAKDRDGEVVNPKGGMLKEFKANPVVLWGHDSKSLPIGRCDKIVSDEKGLIAKTVYASHPFAEQVYQYRKEGFPLACSIGFIPLKVTQHEKDSEEYLKGISRTYDKWLLLEYSECPVPSNPEALALAVSKGLLTQEQAKEYILVDFEKSFNELDNSVEKEIPDFKEYDEEGTPDTSKRRAGDVKNDQDSSSSSISSITINNQNPNIVLDGYTDFEVEQVRAFAESLKVDKPGWDETDAMIRHRVREPGLFVDGSFRTVPIKRDKPRVNSVMGKLKADADPKPMKIQNLMFPKVDGWTIITAKAWAGAHPDLLKWMDEETLLSKAIDFYDQIFDGIETLGVERLFINRENMDSAFEDSAFELESKSGRTLSAATRKTMNTAVEAMNNAVTAITELLNTSDTPQNDAEGGKGILIQDDEGSSEIGMVWHDTDKELKTTISEAIKRALPLEVNIRESAKEGIYSLLGKV